MLAVASCTVGIVIDHGRVAGCRLEIGVSINQGLVLLGASLDIRLDEQFAAVCDQTSELIENALGKHQSLMVTLFPPRIGEMNEHPV